MSFISIPSDWSTPRFCFGQQVTWNTLIQVKVTIKGMTYVEGYWQYEVEYDPSIFDGINVPNDHEEGIICVRENELSF